MTLNERIHKLKGKCPHTNTGVYTTDKARRTVCHDCNRPIFPFIDTVPDYLNDKEWLFDALCELFYEGYFMGGGFNEADTAVIFKGWPPHHTNVLRRDYEYREGIATAWCEYMEGKNED
jgi:hypothetical protein